MITKVLLKKSHYIIVAFFLIFSSQLSANPKLENEAFWSEWKRAIYYFNNEFIINNDQFLLSYSEPTPEKELKLYLSYLAENNEVCKYPARYRLLKKYNIISTSYHICLELIEYKNRAPVNQFKYIYASESLSSISGMMGHGLLMGEGINNDGKLVQHSYSFYTDLATANQITLALDAFVLGMEGVFALRPYSKDLHRYLDVEERNVWELNLNLSISETEYLHDLLWELRDVNPTYFFQSFNCATLSLYTLSIIKPTLLDHETLFVTPLDVYKALLDESLVDKAIIHSKSESIQATPYDQIQDSIISLENANNDLIASFTPASHLLRTLKNFSRPSTELLIGQVSFNIDDQRVEKVNLYSLLGLSTNGLFSSKSVNIHWERRKEQNSWHLKYNTGNTFQIKKSFLSVLAGAGYNTQKGQFHGNLNVIYSQYFSDDIKLLINAEKEIYKSEEYKDMKLTLSKRVKKNTVIGFGFNKRDSENFITSSIDYHF